MANHGRQLATLDREAVRRAYDRYASIYDRLFHWPSRAGIRAAVEEANRLGGEILEIGVGTGLSLPFYRPEVRVIGIDLSPEMLAQARRRVAQWGLAHVVALEEGDAAALPYGDASFDVVVMSFVITAVPDPAAVLAEAERVLRAGGSLVVASHLRGRHPLRRLVEDGLDHLTRRLGWRSNFDPGLIIGRPGLRLVVERRLPPFGLVTLLRLERQGEEPSP